MTNDLLRPNNHELWTHVRLMAIARDPVYSWEEIAYECGLDAEDVPALLAWFLAYRLPPAPRRRARPADAAMPRHPGQRAEYMRLLDREESLVTIVTEAPRQLAAVQLKMEAMERRKPAPAGHRFAEARKRGATSDCPQRHRRHAGGRMHGCDSEGGMMPIDVHTSSADVS